MDQILFSWIHLEAGCMPEAILRHICFHKPCSNPDIFWPSASLQSRQTSPMGRIRKQDKSIQCLVHVLLDSTKQWLANNYKLSQIHVFPIFKQLKQSILFSGCQNSNNISDACSVVKGI